MLMLPVHFLRSLYSSRSLLISLTKRDIQSRYLGSFLGMVWAFIQPLVTLLVIWFVFQFGFKSQLVHNSTPFTLWLISAMIPWFFVSEALVSSAYSIVDQASIVKKVVFKVSLLPVVKINSSLVIHLFFVALLVLTAVFYGYAPNWGWLQIIYYMFSTLFFLLGSSWLTSSIIVFFKDLGQILSVVVQIGFWATPIFWELSLVPEKYWIYFKINPFYYITEGYRTTICGGAYFWEKPYWSLYFWGISSLFFILGIIFFKRLKPHFADVL